MTRNDLTRAEKEDLHSVLRRAAERLERQRAVKQHNTPDPEADALAAAVADLEDELAGMR